MSQEERDLIFGRVTREHSELERQVSSLASKLKAFGVVFGDLGRSLQTWPYTPSVERGKVEKAVAELWETLGRYSQAASDAAAKKSELESLKGWR